MTKVNPLLRARQSNLSRRKCDQVQEQVLVARLILDRICCYLVFLVILALKRAAWSLLRFCPGGLGKVLPTEVAQR